MNGTNDTRERMQEVARYISTILPPYTGFVFLAFDFDGKPGRMEYISNAKREDVLKGMNEFISKNKSPDNWGKYV